MRRGGLVAAVLIAAMAAASPGRAADRDAEVARAKSYFDAGVQAYEAAHYLAAADSFLTAHALLPSPSLIFSAAQAYRRQFFIEKSPEHLREALRLYRIYLSQAEQGRRRQEAAEALAELTPFELRLGAADASPRRERPTQVLVTSRTPGAQTSIDGGPPFKVPLVSRVSPGEHVVVVRAPGYFEETTKIIAVEHETFSLNVPLRPRPVELDVRGDEGAKLYVDGQLLTRLPSTGSLMLREGVHHVAVTAAGRVPYSTSLSVQSGSRVELTVALPPTTQRYASYATLALGGAGVVVTGALAAVAFDSYDEALEIDQRREKDQISAEEARRYNEVLLRDRDTYLAGTAIAGSITAVLGLTVLGLYIFDNPDVAAAVKDPSSGDSPAPAKPEPELLIDGSGVALRWYF